MITILAVAALVVIVAGATVLIFSAHIPGLRVITGAAPLLPEEPAVTAPLPLDDNPEQHADAVDSTYRTARQARADYEASQAAGYVESLADYDLRRSLHQPAQTRKEP